jgi:hypothetical protein
MASVARREEYCSPRLGKPARDLVSAMSDDAIVRFIEVEKSFDGKTMAVAGPYYNLDILLMLVELLRRRSEWKTRQPAGGGLGLEVMN